MQVIAFRSNGDTSNIERVFLYKDSGATAGTEGDPITGLTNASTGLNISTIANNEATANTDTSAATSSIETVTTLGTYATPTAGFVRFREVDATNMPGLYELQWENARYAVASAIWLDVTISGVADLAPFHGRIYLNALPANVTELAGGAQSLTDLKDFADAGYDPVTNKVQGVVLADTVTTLTNLPAITTNWLTAAGIAASALDGKGDWNIGKTGYSLTQTFPTNFSDLAITATTGQVTVGTNNDKTGYTASTVSDKTGYSLTATTGLGNQTADITGNLSGSVGSVTGAVGSVTGHTAQTGDTYALANGATGFTAIDTVVDSIKVVTDALGSAAATKLAASMLGVESGAFEGTPSTTSMQTDLAETTDSHYNGSVLIITSGAGAGQRTDITGYTGATGTLTVTAVTTAPAAADTFVIV